MLENPEVDGMFNYKTSGKGIRLVASSPRIGRIRIRRK
jgi:hypothetical protein